MARSVDFEGYAELVPQRVMELRMRDVVAFLSRELEKLEAELAADPRFRKAQKIRELLALYSAGTIEAGDTGNVTSLSLGRRTERKPRRTWLRLMVRRSKEPEGSAATARSRLIAISQPSHWSGAVPAWSQLTRDAMGRPLGLTGQIPLEANWKNEAVPARS